MRRGPAGGGRAGARAGPARRGGGGPRLPAAAGGAGAWVPVPFVAWPARGCRDGPGMDLVVSRRRAPARGRLGGGRVVRRALPGGRRGFLSLPGGRARGRPLDDAAADERSDQLATAVVMLELLDRVGLGPRAGVRRSVATALDRVAVACSPHRDLAVNPAKMLAIAMADLVPSCGAASAGGAGRRGGVRRSIRQRASGRSALAGDALTPAPIARGKSRRRDVFDDPGRDGRRRRPLLLVLDDSAEDAGRPRAPRAAAQRAAADRGIRSRRWRRRPHRGRPLRLALVLSGRYAPPSTSGSASSRRREQVSAGLFGLLDDVAAWLGWPRPPSA
ncbi:MAG: hypothetical protein R2734_05310 [Nocardioides sp.]